MRGPTLKGLVTGAAQGIGEAVARHLVATTGAEVALADIQFGKVSQVATSIGMRAYAVDIASKNSSESTASAVAKDLGAIDFLVNVAGIDAQFVSPTAIDDEHWHRMIDVNLTGTWNMTKACLPVMIAQGAARIVNISSICGVVPTPGVSAAYAAAKAGIIGLTMSLATELEGEGILVNAIAPGATGSTGQPMTETQAQHYRDAQALGFGGPQPIAHAVEYLLGAGGDWLSGTVLNVSGGFWRGR
ncbi:SDR family NAD(P)-dependent oxidoreductase [Mycolicibacterium sp. YH-1]|uniref:SDR family NAD(P)-dependent oxidoreductase n=1 Tax=Mycolicibacterium sp. YH-1 TaxID=2908837 RepID=UPI001F4C2813|nr:SDR family oxidoreductase [Mycolicibacterium sp. YH-1]UNB50812.1 SDR family oxidoreductase [Mycolicibacterium sp. YH-1]